MLVEKVKSSRIRWPLDTRRFQSNLVGIAISERSANTSAAIGFISPMIYAKIFMTLTD